MLKERVNEYRVGYAKMHVCRIMVQFLGGILCGLLSVPVAFGEVENFSPKHSGIGEKVVQPFRFTGDFSKRRDPFKPIKKRRAISSTLRKARSEPPELSPIPTSIPTMKNPNWKLLGIIYGQNGRQAVIQISPQERVFVRPGLEVVRSGWVIKTISRGEVLLEHLSSLTSGKSISEPKAFILSFPTLGKPS